MTAPALNPFGSLFVQRVTVGVGDMAASNNPQVVLTTYALGSCIGVIAYDPAAKAAGLLHFMLPESKISPEKARTQPAMFADSGLPLLLRALVGLKADPRRLRLFLAGGASVLNGADPFKIGERNIVAIRAWLSTQGLRPQAEELSGTINRTVGIEVATGAVTMKTPHGTSTLRLS
jgi:chemotaxis protein CheD